MKSIPLVHDLLATIEHRAVRDALAAYDLAVTDRAEHRPPADRRGAAETALWAEHDAAARERRAPKLTAATLTAAEEAMIDDRLRAEALDRNVTRCGDELDQAVVAAGAHVWHSLAVARAAALRDDPALDPVPAPIVALWGQFTLPTQAWCPALVYRGDLQRWDVPAMRPLGMQPGRAADLVSVRGGR